MSHPSNLIVMLYKNMVYDSIKIYYDVTRVHQYCYWNKHNHHSYKVEYTLYNILQKFHIFFCIIFICWMWSDIAIHSNYKYNLSKNKIANSNKNQGDCDNNCTYSFHSTLLRLNYSIYQGINYGTGTNISL